MSKPTKYGLKKYIKAIEIIASQQGFNRVRHYNNKGSKYSFQLYQQESDTTPCAFWAVHYEHSRKEEIHPRDFKKAWSYLGVTEEAFLEVINNL